MQARLVPDSIPRWVWVLLGFSVGKILVADLVMRDGDGKHCENIREMFWKKVKLIKFFTPSSITSHMIIRRCVKIPICQEAILNISFSSWRVVVFSSGTSFVYFYYVGTIVRIRDVYPVWFWNMVCLFPRFALLFCLQYADWLFANR